MNINMFRVGNDRFSGAECDRFSGAHGDPKGPLLHDGALAPTECWAEPDSFADDPGCSAIEFLLGDVVPEALKNKKSAFNLKIINLLQYHYNDIGILDIYVDNNRASNPTGHESCYVLQESIPLAANVTIPFDFILSNNNIKFSIYLLIKTECKELVFQILEIPPLLHH